MVASKPLSIKQVSQFDVNFIFFGKTYTRRKCDRRDRIQFHKPFPPSTLDESTAPSKIRLRGDGWGGCDITGIRQKLNSKIHGDLIKRYDLICNNLPAKGTVKLRICSCLACVYRVMDARGKFGEHERCVRFARGDSRVQL